MAAEGGGHFHFGIESMFVYAISTVLLIHAGRVAGAYMGKQGGMIGKIGVGLGGILTFGGA